jgi:hypothetical protein
MKSVEVLINFTDYSIIFPDAETFIMDFVKLAALRPMGKVSIKGLFVADYNYKLAKTIGTIKYKMLSDMYPKIFPAKDSAYKPNDYVTPVIISIMIGNKNVMLRIPHYKWRVFTKIAHSFRIRHKKDKEDPFPISLVIDKEYKWVKSLISIVQKEFDSLICKIKMSNKLHKLAIIKRGCIKCGKKITIKCKKCEIVYYCSNNCKEDDLIVHANFCGMKGDYNLVRYAHTLISRSRKICEKMVNESYSTAFMCVYLCTIPRSDLYYLFDDSRNNYITIVLMKHMLFPDRVFALWSNSDEGVYNEYNKKYGGYVFNSWNCVYGKGENMKKQCFCFLPNKKKYRYMNIDYITGKRLGYVNIG